MPFNRPTLPQLRERILADMASRLELKGGLMRRSTAGVLSAVFAGVSHMMHGHLDWMSKQLFVRTAESDYLEYNHASVHGVTRKAASAASGHVAFDGETGLTVPQGTVLKRADGALFTTTEDGFASVAVTAQEAGEAGNCGTGEVLSLVSPIAGIKNNALAVSPGISGGSDAEDDESLRERTLQVIQNPPMGGADHDYVRWAREVPGVTRAWCYDQWMGLGTVGVTFVRDDDDNFIPDSDEVDTVQEHIDAERPVTAVVYVFAPTTKTVNFSITVTPNTEAVHNAVKDELDAFFLREAVPGATLYMSRISEAISAALNEAHHTITLPAADVTCEDNEIAVVGTVTFNAP